MKDDKERVCPRCGRSDGLAWVRRWDVQRGKLLPPAHVTCALEEITEDLDKGEGRAAMN
jgi:hypothetical protein